MYLRTISIALAASLALTAQEPAFTNPPPPDSQNAVKENVPVAGEFLIPPGTKVPLSMINSVSTKTASEGERIYLETVFPILANGKIVIPPGSYVAGTVTDVKRPGRMKGRGELYIRFDSLTLPNGVTRDFRARIGSLDGRAAETLDKEEGKIKSEGNKSGDVKVIGEAAGAGATAGGLAGAAAGHAGMGAGIGAAVGATAGLVGVLVTRGPEAILAKGTTMDMVLDRPLSFTSSDIDFSNALGRAHSSDGPGPLPSHKSQSSQRRWPL